MLNLRNSIVGSAALLATALTVAAAAPVRAETVSIQVSYGDLDLSSRAGLASLNRRIDAAARDICGDDAVHNRLKVSACRHQIARAAQDQVHTAQARQAHILLASR